MKSVETGFILLAVAEQAEISIPSETRYI